MKILIFSDLHLHNWAYGATYKDGANSRLKAQVSVVRQIDDWCMQYRIDEIFFLGDLFHTHGKIDASVLSEAYTVFRRLSRNSHVTVLVGNHDMADRSGRVNSVQWLDGLNNISVMSEPGATYSTGGTNFVFCPYTEDRDTLIGALSNAPKDSIAMLHQGVHGVPMDNNWIVPNEILSSIIIPDKVKHVFTGHYHSYNRVINKLTIVGAPIQHTWADFGVERGWVVYDTDTGEQEFVKSDAPEFRIFDCNSVSIVESDNPNLLKLKGNYVRIRNYMGDKQELRTTLKDIGAASVEFCLPGVNYDEVLDIEPKDFTLEPLIKAFEDSRKVDGPTKEVGKRIRSRNYEAPSFGS
jgi:DNA repair exonuclease SbcCD nuclease subunit